MMGDVVRFSGITTAPEPVEGVLEKAKLWDLERVLVIGHDGDGKLKWGGNFSEKEIIHWLLSCAQRDLLEGYADESGA